MAFLTVGLVLLSTAFTVLSGTISTAEKGHSLSIASMPSCSSASSTCSFVVHNVAYMMYQTLPGGFIDQTPDSITMSFDVTNSANGVNTACSFTVGKYNGQWTDRGTTWFTCGKRTIVDDQGSKYVVQTNTRFNWDAWQLAVNQTWTCDEGDGGER
jgi:hypothetical protein